MTATRTPIGQAAPKPPARPTSLRVLRLVGWLLVAAGTITLLYVVYALWLTGFETDRAQQDLAQRWRHEVAEPGAEGQTGGGSARETDDDGSGEDEAEGPELAPGAVAMIEFVRPGGQEQPVVDEPLFVVDDVGYADLRRGPGHYPETAVPGADGNFAVAGHRTTYGAPFYALDELREGDEVHVTDRSGVRHVYEFVEREIVGPTADWVLGEDPLGTGHPTLTLTTCHPRFSASQRMIVFAELVER